jgi:hypothetical protein
VALLLLVVLVVLVVLVDLFAAAIAIGVANLA